MSPELKSPPDSRMGQLCPWNCEDRPLAPSLWRKIRQNGIQTVCRDLEACEALTRMLNSLSIGAAAGEGGGPNPWP